MRIRMGKAVCFVAMGLLACAGLSCSTKTTNGPAATGPQEETGADDKGLRESAGKKVDIAAMDPQEKADADERTLRESEQKKGEPEAAGLQEKSIYSFDFLSDPAEARWTYEPSKNGGRIAYVKSGGWQMEKGGNWTSPKISVPDRPFGFYRATFQSKAEMRGYYAFFFYDSMDRFAVDDDYGSVYKSHDWAHNDVVFRARPDTSI